MPSVLEKRRTCLGQLGSRDGRRWARNFATYLELAALTTWWDSRDSTARIDETDLVIAVMGRVDAEPQSKQWLRLLKACRLQMFGTGDTNPAYLESFVLTVVDEWRPMAHRFRGAF